MQDKKLKHNLIFILCLTSIIPLLVVMYLSNPEALNFIGKINIVPVIALITIVIAGIGIYLLFNISKSINSLTNNADNLAKGNIPVQKSQVSLHVGSEVAGLAESLNLITEQLVFSVDELERRAILLERSNAELEKLNKVRIDFINTLSHEMRTPLINVEKALTLFFNNEFGNITSIQKEKIKIMYQNVERLLNLINDILDVSKIDAGELVIEKEEVDLSNLIEDSMNTVNRWRESKGINLTLKIPSNIPKIYVDPERIEQVFINLLSNAIKFTPPRGNVEISAQIVEKKKTSVAEKAGNFEENLKGDYLTVSVTDTGIGIEKQNLDKIFDRFFSLKKSQPKQSFYSTGLGLSIVKEIISLHKGFIEVKSEVGKGSTFTVILPLFREENPAA